MFDIKTVLVVGTLSLIVACADNGASSLSAPSPSPSAPSPSPSVPSPSITGMKGTVSDTAFHDLAGVTIEILNGPSAGLTTTSDASGQWGFAGGFDDSTQFRATKEGYEPSTKPLGPFCAACKPNRWVNFVLPVHATPVSIAGSYTMTVTADRACANFPEQLRTRTYGVTLPSAGNAYFFISPTGANFVPAWNQFEGGVSGNYVGFWFETLVEEIAPGNYLMFGMSAGGFVGPERSPTITIQGDGEITYCAIDPVLGVLDDCFHGRAVTYANCSSKQHTLVLTPR